MHKFNFFFLHLSFPLDKVNRARALFFLACQQFKIPVTGSSSKIKKGENSTTVHLRCHSAMKEL